MKRDGMSIRLQLMFRYTDCRDVRLVIDNCPDASTSCFKINVLHLYVRTVDKYRREQE